MQNILPGVHGFPMSQRPLFRTRETGRAIQAIRRLAEPFTFTWDGHALDTEIEATGALLERIRIFGVRHSAPVLIRSDPLRSNYILLPMQGEIVGKINRTELHAAPGEALVFAAGTCLHAHWSPQCVAMVLGIAKEELDLEARGMTRAPGASLLPPKMVLAGGAARSFVNVLGCLCADCDLQQDGDSIPAVRQSLQRALLVSLLQMNTGTDIREMELERASTRRRRAGVARAVDFLHLNMHRKVDTGELARVAYLSLRSLQIGFVECFGMGPMKYSKRLRLVKARHELQNADPRYTSVTHVAGHWGFPCGNTFSRLYRQNFGELPSQTLDQPGSPGGMLRDQITI